jgi:hypothetical protein
MTVKAAARGYRIEQVPVWTNREAGRSSFRMLKSCSITPLAALWDEARASRSLPIAAPIAALSLVLTGWLLTLARGRRNE